jgi:DNA topoisomerase-3
MLILCEKPSVARDFAEALGCGGRRGYYQNEKVTVTYCVGHLFELAKPENYNPSYKVWDVTKLPIIPETFRYKPMPDVASQADIVLSLLRNYVRDDMVVATDAGREGELIARIVFKEAGITDISSVRRFWVSEALTKEVIRKGLETAKPWQEYNRIALEGAVRQQADWLIGINLTRYMTCGNNTLFSVGRVQTALLNAIALRNNEVARFTPVPFSELEASIQSSNGAMGDQNVDLFREKFRLLSGRYPGYAQHCEESLVIPGNRNIFNSAALEDHHALIPLAPLPDKRFGAGEKYL